VNPGPTIKHESFNGMASHMASPREKKFESALFAGIIMVTVIWDEKGVIFVNFLPRGTAVNSDHCNETLKCLNANLC
jgi:hypothetical protein